MTRNEGKFQDWVADELKEYDIPYLIMNSVQRRGIPDLHATYEGHSIWLELKTAARYDDGAVSLNHDLDAVQSKVLRDFGESGALSGVLTEISPKRVAFTAHDRLSPGPHDLLPVEAELTYPGLWLKRHFATSSDQ